MPPESKYFLTVIRSRDLLRQEALLLDLLSLVERVYDSEHKETFLEELKNSPDALVAFITNNFSVIGLGCICESHASFGVYELFWGMVDEEHRGKGLGKTLVEKRIQFVRESCVGKHKPTDFIAVTEKTWHLYRCGFTVIKKLKSGEGGEYLMYKL